MVRSFKPNRNQEGRQYLAPQREASHKRGYDWQWKKLRDRYKAAHPKCEYCNERPTHEVDHVIPFESLRDPKRLQWSNLKSACRSCHAKKTWADKRGKGTKYDG